MISSPTGWLLTFAGIGVLLLWLGRLHGGRALVSIALLSLGLIAVLPVEQWAIRPLEERFPAPADLAKLNGIIVLGGAVDAALSVDRGQPSLNDAAERMTQAVVLARKFPEAKLVFTGGPIPTDPAGPREADAAKLFFTALGVDPAHMQFESESRTSWENAEFTQAIVHPAEGEVWLLVTSAMHMPRAIGTFRAAGLDLVAYPVGYKSYHGEIRRMSRFVERLQLLDEAAHEWVGLAYYRLRGRSSALFPAPNPAPPAAAPLHTSADPQPG